jgi:DNA polymerase III subunit alpha
MQLKDQYIENKHAPDKIIYDHPLLEPILGETYGIALYQEQVMQIVQAVAGFSLGQADILRRAMGKKKAALMAEQREKFLEGAAANKIDKSTAETLFQRIEQFAGYGFNKSHSMAYAFVAYQTAFLKANYPVEFMAALLTSESGNMDKIAQYVEECRQLGIKVLPPDVNTSCYAFTVEGNAIRFGIGAVKNVGEGPVEAIVTERDADGPFKDIFDFCGRIDSRLINRRVIESLNKAGAFASTSWNRRQVEDTLDSALSEGQISQRERAAGQTSLLDLMAEGGEEDAIRQCPDLPEWPEPELLALEKEMLGLYVSSHPLARHSDLINRFSSVKVSELADLPDGQEVTVGGLVSTVKHHVTPRGKRMGFVTLETLENPCEVVVFSDIYELTAEFLVPDEIIMMRAKVNFRNDEPSLLAEQIVPIDQTESCLTRAVHVSLSAPDAVTGTAERLAEVLGAHPGKCDVYLHCFAPDLGEVTVHATDVCRVAATTKLRGEVEALLGQEAIWYTGGNGLPRHMRD